LVKARPYAFDVGSHAGGRLHRSQAFGPERPGGPFRPASRGRGTSLGPRGRRDFGRTLEHRNLLVFGGGKMTPPIHKVSRIQVAKSIQDCDQNGKLGLKDQVEVPDPRSQSGTRNITVDYFLSVEYRDPAGRSPAARLGDVIRLARSQAPKGRFLFEPDVVPFALEHQALWMK